MTKCERLQEMLDEAHDEGDGPLIEVLEAALVVAQASAASGGGTGSGDGPPP